MAWWSSAWERLQAGMSRSEVTSLGAAAVGAPAASTASTVQRLRDWTTAAPMPRVIDPHPLIAPLDPFTAGLPTRRSPAFLAPLEHVVSPDGGGIVSGLATVTTEAATGPVLASTPPPPPAAATPAAVQRQRVEPDLVLPVSPTPVAPTRERAVPVIARAAGDSLLRAADPAPPRELPVVARLVDASADAAPGIRPAPSTPRAPEPQPSPAASPAADHCADVPQPGLPVVARSLADPAAGLDHRPGLTPAPDPALRTVTTPQAVSSSGQPSGGASSAARTEVGPPTSIPPASPVTVTRSAVHGPDPGAPLPLSPPAPVAVAVADVQRAGDAGPRLPPSPPPSSRPTFGLGAPLTDVEHASPAEARPVAVGFAAFPFGDAPAAGSEDGSDATSPAMVVARTVADPPVAGSMSTATREAAGGRSWTGSATGHHGPPTPLPAVFTDPVNTVQRAVAATPAADAGTSTEPLAPMAVTGRPVVGVRAAAVGSPATAPSIGRGAGPSVISSAGEAAVQAGVAQRALDGSYVFAAPVPSSTETARAETALATAPLAPIAEVSSPGTGALPLRTTGTGSEQVGTVPPVAQRLWGSDALNPGALAERARDAVPTLPTAALPGSLPHVPALPSLPALPPVPGLPSVPSLSGLPSMPSAPGLPAVPTPPAMPTLPTGAEGLPGLPGSGSLPGVSTLPLPPTVPTLSAPTLPTLPTLPSVPSPQGIPSLPGISSLPGIPSVPGAPGAGLPGVPAAPALPALPVMPSSADGSGLPFLSGIPVGGPAVAGPASLPAGPGGGVDHLLPSTAADRPITSTAPAAAPSPEPSPPPASPPAAAPAAADGAAGAAPAAATGAATTGAAGVAAAAPGLDIDDLARRLIDPISARLRTELWLDRERAGLLTDL